MLGRVFAKMAELPTEFFQPERPSARWTRSAAHVLPRTLPDREVAVHAVENHRSTERPWQRLGQPSRKDVETVLGCLPCWWERFVNHRCNRGEQVTEPDGVRTQRVGRDFTRPANDEWPGGLTGSYAIETHTEAKSRERQSGALASALSNTSTFRVCALNSTPTKWIGSPR